MGVNIVLLRYLITEGKFSEEILKTPFSPLEWTIEQFENIDDDDAAAVGVAPAAPVCVVFSCQRPFLPGTSLEPVVIPTT